MSIAPNRLFLPKWSWTIDDSNSATGIVPDNWFEDRSSDRGSGNLAHWAEIGPEILLEDALKKLTDVNVFSLNEKFFELPIVVVNTWSTAVPKNSFDEISRLNAIQKIRYIQTKLIVVQIKTGQSRLRKKPSWHSVGRILDSRRTIEKRGAFNADEIIIGNIKSVEQR